MKALKNAWDLICDLATLPEFLLDAIFQEAGQWMETSTHGLLDCFALANFNGLIAVGLIINLFSSLHVEGMSWFLVLLAYGTFVLFVAEEEHSYVHWKTSHRFTDTKTYSVIKSLFVWASFFLFVKAMAYEIFVAYPNEDLSPLFWVSLSVVFTTLSLLWAGCYPAGVHHGAAAEVT